MPLTDGDWELAENCYGYGSWDACHWFIGLEEGQAEGENDDFTERLKAFRKLNKEGLSDCRAFHVQIKYTGWHFKNEQTPNKKSPPLQRTWRPLMLLMKTFLKEPADNESLRAYQQEGWGDSAGQACVIELSGLPARNTKTSKKRYSSLSDEEKRRLDNIRDKRLDFIHKKMIANKPKFVVIYGQDQKKYWMKFWKDNGVTRSRFGSNLKIESTIIVFTRHPVQSPNKLWIELGTKLRTDSDRS